jgi:RNA polymerase sigma-70 factor, ECF subfamily
MKSLSQPKRVGQNHAANRLSATRRGATTEEALPIFKELNPDDPKIQAPASAPPGQRTDEQLMIAYRGGDRNSFVELVSRYEKELFHFLARFLGDRTTAEDIFQETFLQVHQSAGTFDSERRFRPWLFTIAANKARDQIRSNARRSTSPLQANIDSSDDDGAQFIDLIKSLAPAPDQPMEDRELRSKVKEAVMAMPDNLREILLLSYFQQFPYKEIGAMLKIPLGTVKSRLHAAVAHFAQNWRAANPDRSSS